MGGGLDVLGSLLSMGGNIASGITAQNSQQWLHGLLASIFQQGGDANTNGYNQYTGFRNDTYPQILQSLFKQNGFLNGGEGSPGALVELADMLKQQNGGIPGAYNNLGGYKGPNGQAAGGTQGLSDSLDPTKQLAQQVFAGGGYTPQGQQGFDQISKLFNSALPGTGDASSMLSQLFGNRGNTDFTSALQGAGRQALSDGGFTPTLNATGKPLSGILDANGDTANNDILRQFGVDALQSRGYTPNSGAGSNSALEGVQNGGRTGTTDALQGRGLDLFNREALLPLTQVLSMARDGAGAAGLQASEKAHRDAINRGGGAGATVANGMQNQGFAEFADQIARNESDATTKALLGQQELQQKEQLAGGGIAGQGAQTETARLGTQGDLLSKLESGATNRYSVGGNLANAANDNETQRLLSALGLIPRIQDSATNVMGTVGGLGVQGGKLANDSLGLGTDLFKNLSGNELSKNSIGLGSLSQLLGNQQQYALGAGGLANSATNTQGNLLLNLLQNSMSGGKLDLETLNSLFSTQNQGNKSNIDLFSLLSGNLANGQKTAQDIFSPYLNYAQQGLSTMAAPVGGSGSAGSNPFAALSDIGLKKN